MDDSNNGGGGGAVAADFFGGLPEGFIANTLSLTSPRDACRLSLVASIFRSASEWDAVWERFLPSDYQDIIAQAVDRDGLARLRFSTKKELYMHICDHPILIDGGNKSFSLDKCSGKKCYMLAARDLSIVWGDTPRYWRWTSLPETRFTEVAELISVCWLEIHGKISTSKLSPYTAYAAYLVFKSTVGAYGFEYQAVEVSIGTTGDESETRTVYLDSEGVQNRRRLRIGLSHHRGLARPLEPGPTKGDGLYPKERPDGWLEIEIGEYVNKGENNGELVMSLTEVKRGNWKGGLIVQGIEIRPKFGKRIE